ncbi:MAG: hypothetical protein WA056_10605 [Gallionella sp.]
MKFRLKRIPLDLAEPGMQLAAAVCNQRGDVLLQAGCELSESALSGLRKRGIAHIAIQVADARGEDELAAERAKVLERLNLLFRNAGRDEHLASLYQLVLEYRLEGLA